MDNKVVDNTPANASAETNSHVEAVLHKAHDELRELLQQRVTVTRRIGSVKQTIVGLIKLFGDGALPADLLGQHEVYRRGTGVTDSCRRVLMEANGPISSRNVRDRILQTSPAVPANHKDPLATVNTILCRLAEYGEARAVISNNGQRAWQWAAESEPADQDSPSQTPESPAR